MNDTTTADSEHTEPPGLHISGKWLVIGLAVTVAATAATFTGIQLSGRGAARENFYALSMTAALREFEAGYHAEAVQTFSDVIEGGNPIGYGWRGEANLRSDKIPEAIADYRQAVRAFPNDPVEQAGYGAALAAGGFHEKAVERYSIAERLFEKQPAVTRPVRRTGDTLPGVLRLRAASFDALGRTEAAVADRAAADRLAPTGAAEER